jgi:hypothetical protein
MRLLGLIMASAALAAPAFAQGAYAAGKQMVRNAKVEAYFRVLDKPDTIMLLHRESGLLCQFFVTDTTRELLGGADAARCRDASDIGDYTRTASRSPKNLEAEHADLRKEMASYGELGAPVCHLREIVPYCHVSATRREGGGIVYTEGFVGVRDGWVFTARGFGRPGQRVELMTWATFTGMVDTPEP